MKGRTTEKHKFGSPVFIAFDLEQITTEKKAQWLEILNAFVQCCIVKSQSHVPGNSFSIAK